jgi:ubiquinol-cytochrome c reductase UQCRX/QCR9 subunit
MSGLASVFNKIVSKTPVYATLLVGGAIASELVWSKGIEAIWDSKNKGVRTAFDL